jgi:hypothetical protein
VVEQRAEPEHRHGDADEREHRQEPVRELSGLPRAEEPQRDAATNQMIAAPMTSANVRGAPLHDLLGDVLLVGVGAQIAAEELAIVLPYWVAMFWSEAPLLADRLELQRAWSSCPRCELGRGRPGSR